MNIELSEKTINSIKQDLIRSCESEQDEIYKDLLDIAKDNAKNGYLMVVVEILSQYILIPKNEV